MFDFDLSKLALFGAVALIVIGPKDLPAALRTVGRVVAQLRGLQGEIRKGVNTLMEDVSLEREIAAVEENARLSLARNPATAMRGSLAVAAPDVVESGMEYASPEMQAYLAPAPEAAG